MLAEPLKSLGKKGKTLKITRTSLKRKKARKSKKARKRRFGKIDLQKFPKKIPPDPPVLSGSHRSTHIASDLASRALASQAKPQRESESQAFRS